VFVNEDVGSAASVKEANAKRSICGRLELCQVLENVMRRRLLSLRAPRILASITPVCASKCSRYAITVYYEVQLSEVYGLYVAEEKELLLFCRLSFNFMCFRIAALFPNESVLAQFDRW
jgi:hypothetical protein